MYQNTQQSLVDFTDSRQHGRMGLGKTQVMKNKDVVVRRGEMVGGGGEYRRNSGDEFFVQTDNFFSIFLRTSFAPYMLFLHFSLLLKSVPISPQFVCLHLHAVPLKGSRNHT